MATTSQIYIDKVYRYVNNAATTPVVIPIEVTQPNSLVLIGITVNSGALPATVQVNGQAAFQEINAVDTNGLGDHIAFYSYKNPPVGSLTVNMATANAGGVIIYVIQGASLKEFKYISVAVSNASAAMTANLQVPYGTAMLFDLGINADGTSYTPGENQVRVYNRDSGSADTTVSSYKFVGTGAQVMTESGGTSAQCMVAIVIPAATSPSMWAPNIDFRNSDDVVKINALNTQTLAAAAADAIDQYGQYASVFFQNSFLHTIGRIIPPQLIATIVAETEQTTSQIIIDKIYQGQLASTPVTINTLNMQVNIPSPDAVLVVTGGSVIATGGAWTGVQLNGNPLTKLIQIGVAGQSAEIWYAPFPSVGTGTLSIASASGGEINANAMVILGIDKRSTNIQVASATDAASTTTIGALITPDAPNSLIIDTLSTLNATTFPVPDSSQTQVFNATALASSEYVMSTYKLGTGQQNMNYNLSIAVNASLVAVAFRPAQAASMWFPNIDFRELDDVVTVAGLDSEVNPSFGQYGYKASTFYLNSFLHTVGRNNFPSTPLYGALRDGLVSYYKLDENTGSNVNDELHTNPGIWEGTLGNQWKRGIINSGGNFNGIDNDIRIQSDQSQTFTSGITVALWIIPQNLQNAFTTLVSKANNWYFENPGDSTNSWRFAVNLAGNEQNSGNFTPIMSPNIPHLIVGTYDRISGNIFTYLDGIFVAGQFFAGNLPINNPLNNIVIGNRDGFTRNFSGVIDEFGIWNRALSSFEVAALYNLGQGLSYPFLPNNNITAIAVQGYNYYSQFQRDFWQTSFLQTIGRIPFNTPVIVAAFNSWKMMTGVGL